MSVTFSALAPGEGRVSTSTALLPWLAPRGSPSPAWCWCPVLSQCGCPRAAWLPCSLEQSLGASCSGGWSVGKPSASTDTAPWEPLEIWSSSSALTGRCQPWLQMVFLPHACFFLLIWTSKPTKTACNKCLTVNHFCVTFL